MNTKQKSRLLSSMIFSISCFMILMAAPVVMAQDWKAETPEFLTTPDKVESKRGTLEFQDGYPIGGTAENIRDELDYLHGVQAFMNSIQGVSTYAIRKGLMDIGVKENEFIIYSKLMDSKSLFLTGNADTVYYIGVVDLSNGPMVFHSPPGALGVIDDMWFRWVTDFGLPGADRGNENGGKYLLVGPGYDGTLPEGGFIIRKARTSRVLVLGRSFLTDNDPVPTVAVIKNVIKLYPYTPGGTGTSIGSYLTGEAPTLGQSQKPMSPRWVEATGRVMNTIPPNDFGHFEMLNELVQMESADALDPEIAGHFEAIGIVKGKKFTPDARMRKILEKAVAFGNAASRMLGMGAHPVDHFRYYDTSSQWWNFLFVGGYEFLNPPPQISKDGKIKPYPNSGARKLHSRTSMFYTATGITPSMCMRLTGVGSQYLLANLDTKGKPFEGSKTYKVTLPKDIPAERFWSLTVYDNQTRSMLQTPQVYPRAGSQSFPSPSAAPSPNGSTTIYFGPKQPQGIERGNWIQTDPDKGWFVILRLYSPLQSFFDKSWRVGEIELVK